MSSGARRDNAAKLCEDEDGRLKYYVNTYKNPRSHPVLTIGLPVDPNVSRHMGEFVWSGYRDKAQISFLLTLLQYTGVVVKRLIDMKVCCMRPEHPDECSLQEENVAAQEVEEQDDNRNATTVAGLSGLRGIRNLDEDEDEDDDLPAENSANASNSRSNGAAEKQKTKAKRPPNPSIQVTMTLVGMQPQTIVVSEEQVGFSIPDPPSEVQNVGQLHGIGALSQSAKDFNYTKLNSGGDSGYIAMLTFSTTEDEEKDDKVRDLIQSAYDRLFLITHRMSVLNALNDGSATKQFFESNIGYLNHSTILKCIQTYFKQDAQCEDWDCAQPTILQHFSIQRAIDYARRKLHPMHSSFLRSNYGTNIHDITARIQDCSIEECSESCFVRDQNAVIRVEVGNAEYVQHSILQKQCITCRMFCCIDVESYIGPIDLCLSILQQLRLDAMHAKNVSSNSQQTSGILRPNEAVGNANTCEVTMHADFVPITGTKCAIDPWKTCESIEGYKYTETMKNPVYDCLTAFTAQARRNDVVGEANWEHQLRSARRQDFVPAKNKYVLDTMVNSPMQKVQQLITLYAMNNKSTADPRVLIQMCITNLSTCIQQEKEQLNTISLIYGPPGGGKTHYLQLVSEILKDPELEKTMPSEKLPLPSIVVRTITPQACYQLGHAMPAEKNVLKWSVSHTQVIMADCPEEYLIKGKQGTPSLIPYFMAIADEHEAERLRTDVTKDGSSFQTRRYRIEGCAMDCVILANIPAAKLTKHAGVTETKLGYVPQALLDRVACKHEFELTAKQGNVPIFACPHSNEKPICTYINRMTHGEYSDMLKNQDPMLKAVFEDATRVAVGVTRNAALLLSSVDSILCHWETMGRHRGTFFSSSAFLQAFCRIAQPLRASDSRKQKAISRCSRIMLMYSACVAYLQGEWKGSNDTIRKELSGTYVFCPVVSARNCLYKIAFADMAGVISLACSQIFDTASLVDRFMLNIVRLLKSQTLHQLIFAKEATEECNRKRWMHTGFVTTANGNANTKTGYMQRLYLMLPKQQIDDSDDDQNLVGDYEDHKSRSGKRNRVGSGNLNNREGLRDLAEWLIVNWVDDEDSKTGSTERNPSSVPTIDEIVEKLRWLLQYRKSAAMCTAYIKKEINGKDEWVVAPEYDLVEDDMSLVEFKTASKDELTTYGYKEQQFMQAQMMPVPGVSGCWSFAQDVIARNHLGEANYKECQAPMCTTLTMCALMMSLSRFVGNEGLARAYVKYAEQIKSTVDETNISNIVISPPEYATKNFILAVFYLISPTLKDIFEGALQEDLNQLPLSYAMRTVFNYAALEQKRQKMYQDAHDISEGESLLTLEDNQTVEIPEIWWHMFACNVAGSSPHGKNKDVYNQHYRATYRDIVVPFVGIGYGYPMGGLSTTGNPSCRTVYDILQEALHCLTQAAEIRGPEFIDLNEDRTIEEYVRLLKYDLQFDPFYAIQAVRENITKLNDNGIGAVEGMLPTDLQSVAVKKCNTMQDVQDVFCSNHNLQPVAISMIGPDTMINK